MSCLCDDGTGMVPGVAIVDGITHALAPVGNGDLYCLCHFDKYGTIRAGHWVKARISPSAVIEADQNL